MSAVPDSFHNAWQFAQQQVLRLAEQRPGYYPMYTVGGKWGLESDRWTHWCEGFFPGMMWLFARTGEPERWRELAIRYTEPLEARKYDDTVHDLGFIFIPTFVRWAQLDARDVPDCAVVAGITLAGRYLKRGGYIPSFIGPHSLFVDIMMNVPIVFVAADWIRRSGRLPEGAERTFVAELSPSEAAEELWRRGLQHCRTSKQYLVREDGSTAHEAIFNPDTGQFVRQSTHQGASESSCWSRGQAWALYGFARSYRLTGESDFLTTAQQCADYFLQHLPPDGVPHWDFSVAHEPDQPRDSSAAAIAASGLFTLAELVSDAAAERYRNAARQILETLCTADYLAEGDPEWEGILKHAVYHLHKGLGVDESVAWGEYYFVEALYKQIHREDIGP